MCGRNMLRRGPRACRRTSRTLSVPIFCEAWSSIYVFLRTLAEAWARQQVYRVVTMKINRHDKAFLDKQLWGVDPHPPSLIGLGFAAIFLGGIVIGSVLFAREYSQAHATSTDVTGTVSPQKPRVQVLDSKTERTGKAN